MGLNYNEIKFLLWAKSGGVDFSKTMMIGRQRLYLTMPLMAEVFSQFGIHESEARLQSIFSEQKGYAEPFFQYLGAKEANSMDASTYEGASHVWDMNQPIPEDLKTRFSVVLDGGSLEHVFNFPVAIRNCMEMVQLNGRFIGITPCNNYMGHGFYQFSPELYFRIFTEQNGFELEKVILYETAPMARWYQLIDPQKIGKRVEALTRRNTLLIVQARRTAVKPLFASTPQQSDYVAAWQEPGKSASQPSLIARIKINLPTALKKPLWKIKEWAQPGINAETYEEIHIPH